MKTNEILTLTGISELKNYWANKFLTTPEDFDAFKFSIYYGPFMTALFAGASGDQLDPRAPYVDSPLDLNSFFEALKNFQIESSALINTTNICDPNVGTLETTVACIDSTDIENWKSKCREQCESGAPEQSQSYMAFCPRTSSFWAYSNYPDARELEGEVDMDHMSYMDLFLTDICPDMSEQDIQNQYFLISE